ncbi:MAG TPA: NfeD family protein [Gemmatimonadaceae bacterium]|nr:NfeD family protein [Gemmatimonadaceae bacterium]
MTPSITFFIAAFIAGLLLAVFSMLRGVEKRTGDEIKRPLAGLNLPVFGVALIAFGAVGHMLSRYGVWNMPARFLVAGVSGALAYGGMTLLLAKWALRAPLEDPHELQELIQGHIAKVVEAVGASTPGRIEYTLNGHHHSVAAVSLNGEPIEPGTEVVIDRQEANVAHVEPWASVEPRL